MQPICFPDVAWLTMYELLAGGILAALQAGASCEGDGKTSDAAYRNNWSFSTSDVGSEVSCTWHSSEFKAVVAGL